LTGAFKVTFHRLLCRITKQATHRAKVLGMYHPGGTIEKAVNEISKNNYVLPAIQREFVWRPEQIERLFDSLMQGYPFGAFLFWKVQPETAT